MSSGESLRVVILPGNGPGNVRAANWYGWLEKSLHKAGVEVKLENMPDPVKARESIWLPFMEKESCNAPLAHAFLKHSHGAVALLVAQSRHGVMKLGCNEQTIIVGHSSGAEAAMRYAEQHRVHAIILVSACHTDLGMPSEAVSGYYNRPWLWDEMKSNVKNIFQFGSTDDPFIPWDEQEYVHKSLDSRLEKFSDKGHFCNSVFPELLASISSIVKNGS